MQILYEDNHLLVVVKPAGMLSQADHTGDEDVVSRGKAYIGDRYDKPGNVYLGLVHRLDRPASGVMVLARTSKAASRLTDQFKRRSVRKAYAALVEGTLEGAGKWEDFIRKVDARPEIAPPGSDGAKRALLTWTSRRISGGPGTVSLADIRLETGRPHQIRLQFSSRGYPLVGDMRYGAGTELDGRNLALHAYELGFEHPTKKEPMVFCALPPDTWPDEAVQGVRSLFSGTCDNKVG